MYEYQICSSALVPNVHVGNCFLEAPASRIESRQAGACATGFPTWTLGTRKTKQIPGDHPCP
jgi:hypothetical protein